MLAVWSLLEQGVYGRSLVWLTETASLGRFGDNQYVSMIRDVEDCWWGGGVSTYHDCTV